MIKNDKIPNEVYCEMTTIQKLRGVVDDRYILKTVNIKGGSFSEKDNATVISSDHDDITVTTGLTTMHELEKISDAYDGLASIGILVDFFNELRHPDF